MKRIFLGIFIAILQPAAYSDDAPIIISPVATFSEPGHIADNVKAECDLPRYQAEAVRRNMEELGIQATMAEKDDVAPTGRFVQLRIDLAISTGNGFIGHKKQVTTTARLFENGVEITKYTETRSSSGGPGAMFKGSCSVLERCTEALGKDIAKWLKVALAKE